MSEDHKGLREATAGCDCLNCRLIRIYREHRRLKDDGVTQDNLRIVAAPPNTLCRVWEDDTYATLPAAAGTHGNDLATAMATLGPPGGFKRRPIPAEALPELHAQRAQSPEARAAGMRQMLQTAAQSAPAKSRKQPPGVVRKAANFTRAAAKHILTGAARVDDAEKSRRLEICRACDRFQADTSLCRECGCDLEIKTSWASADCPLKKWGA